MSDEQQPKENEKNYLGQGMAIGAGLGLLFGVLMFDNPAIGVAVGIALGVAIGSAVRPGG